MGGGTAFLSRRNLDHLAVWIPDLLWRDVMCPALFPPGTGSVLFFLTGLSGVSGRYLDVNP
jgi:hypothetical protein